MASGLSMKRFVEGEDRRQGVLLPEFLDDYVSEENPVRAIDVFVEALDLGALGFDGVVPEATGRPGYHPGVLLKIYVYGYINQVASSRGVWRRTSRPSPTLGRIMARRSGRPAASSSSCAGGWNCSLMRWRPSTAASSRR